MNKTLLFSHPQNIEYNNLPFCHFRMQFQFSICHLCNLSTKCSFLHQGQQNFQGCLRKMNKEIHYNVFLIVDLYS